MSFPARDIIVQLQAHKHSTVETRIKKTLKEGSRLNPYDQTKRLNL